MFLCFSQSWMMHGLIESWVNDITSAHVQLCFEEVVDKESAVVQHGRVHGAWRAAEVGPSFSQPIESVTQRLDRLSPPSVPTESNPFSAFRPVVHCEYRRVSFPFYAP